MINYSFFMAGMMFFLDYPVILLSGYMIIRLYDYPPIKYFITVLKIAGPKGLNRQYPVPCYPGYYRLRSAPGAMELHYCQHIFLLVGKD